MERMTRLTPTQFRNLKCEIVKQLKPDNEEMNTGTITDVTERASQVLKSKLASSSEQYDELLIQILDELVAYGPLTTLLRDRSNMEIFVDGPNAVYTRKYSRERKRTALSFESETHLRDIIVRFLRSMNLQISEDKPMVEGRLPDGMFPYDGRVYATFPPATIHGPTLSIVVMPKWNSNSESPELRGWEAACNGDLSTYEFTSEPSSHSARIRALGNASPNSWATVCQAVRGYGYRGTMLRFLADVKTNDAARAGLFIRIDSAETDAAALANMFDSPITGTQDWQSCQLSVKVPGDASKILFGFWLDEAGEVLVRNLNFEIVYEPPTRRRRKPPRHKPLNLDFSAC
jgi:hypothetical protein